MRSTVSKDAAPWHNSGKKEMQAVLCLRQLDKSGGKANGKGRDSFRNRLHAPASPALDDYGTRSFFAENLRLPASCNGSGIALTQLSLARSCVLPRLSHGFMFRIPNRLTESVPNGILLLQTNVVSIH
jgi:hypothetical protein